MTRRLDIELVERGLAPTRNKAQALIMAGDVLIDERRAQKAGELVDDSNVLTIVQPPRFVSRGGEKLERALSEFSIDLRGKLCADIGASTGGFTDAMLQHGAATVYAIDVGYGQIALSLREDPRVIVLDRTNARYLHSLPQPIDFTSIDASFISLTRLFPAVLRISAPGASLVTLIKPQFEAGKGEVGKNGVVRDNSVHVRILRDVIANAGEHQMSLAGLTASPIKGPAGNIEFLGYFRIADESSPTIDAERAIELALAGAPK